MIISSTFLKQTQLIEVYHPHSRVCKSRVYSWVTEGEPVRAPDTHNIASTSQAPWRRFPGTPPPLLSSFLKVTALLTSAIGYLHPLLNSIWWSYQHGFFCAWLFTNIIFVRYVFKYLLSLLTPLLTGELAGSLNPLGLLLCLIPSPI